MAHIVRRTGRPKNDPRYDVRYRDTARKVRTKTFRRKIDAETFAAKVETDLDRGEWINPDDGKVTIGEYAPGWLRARPRPLRPRTLDDYASILDRHIYPTFGRTPLAKITTSDVRAWHSGLLETTGRSRTAKAYRLLRAILGTAADDELILRNPCRIPGAGEDPTPARPFLTDDQVADVVAAMRDDLRLLVILAAGCGLRLGEALALRRRHVDLLRHVVLIEEQTQERKDGTVYFAPPKSAAGRRKVAVPSGLAPAVEAHLGAFAAPGVDGLLFTGATGGPLRRKAFYKAWNAARVEAGLPELHFHDLRHYSATVAAQAGATTKELMARLGHSTMRAALIYQHAAEDRDREIAERIGAVLDAARPSRKAPTPRAAAGK